MTDKHTSEPWTCNSPSYSTGADLFGSNGEEIGSADCFKELTDIRSIEDARRIVACVNACVGLETEDLESSSFRGRMLMDAVAKLNQISQRLHDKTRFTPGELEFLRKRKPGGEW